MGMPTMLRQLVRQIAAGSPDVAVVAELSSALRDPTEVVAARPDVVILGIDETSEEVVTSLLYASPAVRVLGITSDAAQTTLYELRPQRVQLGELGSDALRVVIRAAAEGR
jgi:hypothetical protein